MRREVLQQARQIIEARTRLYICAALQLAGKRQGRLDEANSLTGDIILALEGSTSLEGWLHRQGITVNPEQARLARLAWLDRLIEGSK